MRDPDTAEQEMHAQCLRIGKYNKPQFGMLFSCLGRGPQFYGAHDQDLLTIQQHFKKLPLIGFYGNGEIAPLHGHNQLLQFATVLSLFTA
jgi:small ligand-binding sensory domain FIST